MSEFDAVIGFPAMRVGVRVRAECIAGISFLPLQGEVVAPRNARAVGQACGDNHLPIVIPCHRAVAADGLGGFAHSTGGYLLEAKRWLLLHEMGPERFELAP